MSLQYDPNGKLIDGTQQMQYNGSTYDVVQNNTQGILLASAARTATINSATQTNYNARGVFLIVNVTVIGTGNLVPQILGQTSLVNFIIFSAPTAITATGTYVYEIYPSIATGTANLIKENGGITRNWFANMLKGDASSWTFSVEYSTLL